MKDILSKIILITFASLFLISCSSRGYGSGSGYGTGNGVDGNGYGVDGNGNGIDGQSFSESDLSAQYDARYADGQLPSAEGEGLFRDIHFGYNSSNVDEYALQDIEYNLQVLEGYPNLKLQLEGHSDERGTAEYNMALGSKRAKAVYDAAVSLGADVNNMETVSYGEELPLVQGSSESSWSKNRRVHFAAF